MKKTFHSVLFTVILISGICSTSFAEVGQAYSSGGKSTQSTIITVNNHGMGY